VLECSAFLGWGEGGGENRHVIVGIPTGCESQRNFVKTPEI